jgi:hypothetical protein
MGRLNGKTRAESKIGGIHRRVSDVTVVCGTVADAFAVSSGHGTIGDAVERQGRSLSAWFASHASRTGNSSVSHAGSMARPR